MIRFLALVVRAQVRWPQLHWLWWLLWQCGWKLAGVLP